MKHEFNHELSGLAAHGISKERGEEIDRFCKSILDELETNKKWKKSLVHEKIVEFAETVGEAVAIASFVGLQIGMNNPSMEHILGALLGGMPRADKKKSDKKTSSKIAPTDA